MLFRALVTIFYSILFVQSSPRLCCLLASLNNGKKLLDCLGKTNFSAKRGSVVFMVWDAHHHTQFHFLYNANDYILSD